GRLLRARLFGNLIMKSAVVLIAVVGVSISAPIFAQELVAVTNSLGMKLIRIAPGEFIMGTGETAPRDRKTWETRDWDEAPAHTVKITKPFYMSAHEVTNVQYEQFDPEHRKLRG